MKLTDYYVIVLVGIGLLCRDCRAITIADLWTIGYIDSYIIFCLHILYYLRSNSLLLFYFYYCYFHVISLSELFDTYYYANAITFLSLSSPFFLHSLSQPFPFFTFMFLSAFFSHSTSSSIYLITHTHTYARTYHVRTCGRARIHTHKGYLMIIYKYSVMCRSGQIE